MHIKMRQLLAVNFALLILVSMSINWTLAQSPVSLNEIQKLIAGGDGDPGDYFGASVSVNGDTVVIGAPWNDVVKADDASGSAYVFTRNAQGDWIEQQNLTASDSTNGIGFGSSVSMDKDSIVIASDWNDDGNNNSLSTAYVFTRNTQGVWVEQQKLTSSDKPEQIGSPISVSVDGDTIIMGVALSNGGNGPISGTAYIFTRNTQGVWAEQQKLIASDGAVGDTFGWSVDVNGDTAVIGRGAVGSDIPSSGSAYVFTRNDQDIWTEQQKLTASDKSPEDLFGWSVAMNGDTIVAGAMGVDTYGKNSGTAYVFTRNNQGVWTEQQKLLPSDGAVGDAFGQAVSMDEDIIVIRARSPALLEPTLDGKAYVFTKNIQGVWNEQQELPTITTYVGSSSPPWGGIISVDKTTVVFGSAKKDGGNGFQSGLANVFSVNSKTASFNNGVLAIPVVDVDGVFYQAELIILDEKDFKFQLTSIETLINPDTTSMSVFSDNKLSIPDVIVGSSRFRAELELIGIDPVILILTSVEEL